MKFTPEQITHMAREAEIYTPDGHCVTPSFEIVERLCNLAAEAAIKAAPEYKMGYADGAEAEREACAKVCERGEYAIDGGGSAYYRPADARWCAAAIRARGQE